MNLQAHANAIGKIRAQKDNYERMVDALRRNLQLREDCRKPVHVSTDTRKNAMLHFGLTFMHEGWLQHIEFKSLGGGVWEAKVRG